MATDASATMAPDTSATIPVPEINSSTPTLITINATAQLPVKLTPTNYSSWRAQFNALLYSYDLMGYVDGSRLCPSTTQLVLRTFWIRQDQLLLHAILASVSPQVISLIASAKTSKEAWDKLLRLFASKARARVLGLKERLTLLRRENKLSPSICKKSALLQMNSPSLMFPSPMTISSSTFLMVLDLTSRKLLRWFVPATPQFLLKTSTTTKRKNTTGIHRRVFCFQMVVESTDIFSITKPRR
ncbi:unnamed protein product [Prunus armeniaca]|uniref:Retrotransposon Copia-like N-terminal domain-containing protein n=1 Tax=Prunus armeniaca TaxID=36596 RepID=A0A6J5UE47_PRUAR|nr:unnamed protein product [Prunus armeniaca]